MPTVPQPRGLLPTLWPSALPEDSQLLREKKLVVRGGHLAMAFLVAVAIAGTVATHFQQLSALRLIGLIFVGILYIGWSLHGTRDAVRFVLWHHQMQPVQAWPSHSLLRATLHVLTQFALAESIIWLAGPGGVLSLLWLVLLPPISYIVMFGGWFAIVLTAVASVGLHTLNVVYWHGWAPVPMAMPGFCVAILFTLVFTLIAVSAERARGEVEWLAEELRDANEKLRAHALQAEELAATRERNRVAREIHDSLGHCLTVVHVQLEAARATLDHDPAGSLDALNKAQAMAHSGLQEVRRSVSSLRSSPLDGRPLAEALQQLVHESQGGELVADLTVLGKARPTSPQVGLTIYRAAQEGVTNSRKHGRAKSVRLSLDFSDADLLRLTIADDGVGAEQVQDGFGLLGMRERAQLLGGTTSARSEPGAGFTLQIEVPG